MQYNAIFSNKTGAKWSIIWVIKIYCTSFGIGMQKFILFLAVKFCFISHFQIEASDFRNLHIVPSRKVQNIHPHRWTWKKKKKEPLSSPLFTLNSSGAPLLQLSKSPLVGESGKRRGCSLWFMKVVVTDYPNFRSNFLVIFTG